MTIHHQDATVTLHHGDCLDVLRTLPDNSVDSVATDPPYGLEFMGKEWDKFGTARAPSTASRAGDGAMTGGAGITRTGYTDGGKRIDRPAFGGARPKTWRCDECGKRDQFRNPHDDHNGWSQEVIDPSAPAPSVGFQQWCELWAAECLRVLKPGGHILAFGGTRTWHRLTCAVEDAGFEIRDSIAWMYGSGFPKSLDVSKALDRAAGAEREVVGQRPTYPDGTRGGLPKPQHQRQSTGLGSAFVNPGGLTDVTAPATEAAQQWQGWGTALKPAFEPVVVARKPLTGTVAANVTRWGTGALNVDGCRIGTDEDRSRPPRTPNAILGNGKGTNLTASESHPAGRWPANVVLDESQAAALDEMSGDRPGFSGGGATPGEVGNDVYGKGWKRNEAPALYGDSGGASRFFYTAKAGADERITHNGTAHPTVKPLSLMRWLLRLVTPPGGVILEPFAGSGTTVEAAILEGFRCIAIEREADYLPLITQRIHRRKDPVAYITAAGEDLGLFGDMDDEPEPAPKPAGRWPANVILDRSQAEALDEMSGVQKDGTAVKRNGVTSNGVTGWGKAPEGTPDAGGFGGEGGASRFFLVVDEDGAA